MTRGGPLPALPPWSPRLLTEATPWAISPLKRCPLELPQPRPRLVTCRRSESRVSPRSAIAASAARDDGAGQAMRCPKLIHLPAGLQAGLRPHAALLPSSLSEWHVLAARGSGATEPPGLGPDVVAVMRCRQHPLGVRVCNSGSARQLSLVRGLAQRFTWRLAPLSTVKASLPCGDTTSERGHHRSPG